MRGFTASISPRSNREKSSCHQAPRAAGAETAAARLEKQSGPSPKWPAPFNCHLRPGIPTVKISVHTPRVSLGKRFTTATGPHTHTGLTTTQCCLPPHQWSHRKTRQLLLSAFVRTWPANWSRCVCVCVNLSGYGWINRPVLCSALRFKGTPSYDPSSYPNKVLRRQEVAQWAEIR